ncbi:MAG TPA: hypothetical protein VNV86_13850 [Candidatus Acidoferrum sp.]|nr:hypothetical protein [Candidatus Acidoferrum sp.]
MARSSPPPPRPPGELRSAIEEFLKSAREPALLEPGEDLLPLTADNYTLEMRGSRLTLQAWDRTRNWTRRVVDIADATNARLEMTVERFARRQGQMFLLDLSRRGGADMGKRSGRLVFRERFRLLLLRQFAGWKLDEITAEADLQHSLSPAFPRALLVHGRHGFAAIACPPEGDSAAVLSFALIWLQYLRARERKIVVEGLAIYLPSQKERITALRILCLNPEAARFELFTYDDRDEVLRIDPRDHGNLDIRLDHCRRPAPNRIAEWNQIAELPDVERVPKHDGRLSLRVRGIEFAELVDGEMWFGMDQRRAAHPRHAAEIAGVVEELAGARCASGDRLHPLYRQYPEAWLESMVRTNIEEIDAMLLPHPIYGQVPAFAGGDRGVLDLLAVDRTGRLAVVELKASADVHLPLQALDYWVRVKWHLDRGEFRAHDYFSGIELSAEPPRLLLVSPSLEFHPSTETILSVFAPGIEVVRIGLGVEWRKGLHVMFRLVGAQRPE